MTESRFPANLGPDGFLELERPLDGGVRRLMRNDPTFSDLAGVLAGVKPATYTDCLPAALPALKRLCDQLRLKLLLPELLHGRKGRHFAGDGRKVMVLVGRRMADLRKAADAWAASTVDLPWGLALGYPECCVKAFVSWFRDCGDGRPRAELVRRIAAATGPGPLDFMLNDVWNYFSRLDFQDPADRERHAGLLAANPAVDVPSLHVVSWHPCSYRCAASRRKAREIFSFIAHHSPAYARGLRELLSGPLLFRGKYEFAAVGGTFSRGVLRCRGAAGPKTLLDEGTLRLLGRCDRIKPGREGVSFLRGARELRRAGKEEFLLLDFRGGE